MNRSAGAERDAAYAVAVFRHGVQLVQAFPTRTRGFRLLLFTPRDRGPAVALVRADDDLLPSGFAVRSRPRSRRGMSLPATAIGPLFAPAGVAPRHAAREARSPPTHAAARTPAAAGPSSPG